MVKKKNQEIEIIKKTLQELKASLTSNQVEEDQEHELVDLQDQKQITIA